MKLSQARKIVEASGWLSRQPPVVRDRLMSSAVLIPLTARDEVYWLDAPVGGIYGLASGLLDVMIAPGPFPPRLVHIARPGWWVGEAAAATDTRRRAEIRARTDASVIHVSRKHLVEIAADEPALWRCLATLTVQHLDDALLFAGCLGCDDPTLRLAATLARLTGAFEGARGTVELPVSHEELGEMSGLSRNTVGRILPALEKTACLKKSYGLLVLKPARLRELISNRR